MFNDPDGAEEGEKSKISVRDDVEENSRHSIKESPGMFFPGYTFNKIEQPFYDCLCHGLALARNQFHLMSENQRQDDQHDDRKPGSDESICHSEVANMKHWLRRKLHIGFRNLKEARGFRPKKTGSQRAKHKTHTKED